jgi:hypothetical protein
VSPFASRSFSTFFIDKSEQDCSLDIFEMATSMSEHAKKLCQLGIVDILKTSSECEEYQMSFGM